MGLRGIGPGMREIITQSGPITQSGLSTLTFESNLVVPEDKVLEELELRVKVTVTGTQGGSAITAAQVINKLAVASGTNKEVFDADTIVDACTISALMCAPFPMEASLTEQFTDPEIAAGSTAYTGKYKILQGLGPGMVNVRLDTVNLASLFSGWTTVTNVSVAFDLIGYCADYGKVQLFNLSAERISSTTKASIDDAEAIMLIATATMASISVNAPGYSLSSSQMQNIEDAYTSRIPSGTTKYVQVHNFGKHADVVLTKSAAFSATAVVIRYHEQPFETGMQAAHVASVAKRMEKKKGVFF